MNPFTLLHVSDMLPAKLFLSSVVLEMFHPMGHDMAFDGL